MPKVTLVDCVKQIIVINKELDDQDKRSDNHMIYITQLRNRIEKLEKLLENKNG